MSSQNAESTVALQYQQTPIGIWRPTPPVMHRVSAFNPRWFSLLSEIEQRHFWHRGRLRYLLKALGPYLLSHSAKHRLSAIDIGAGAGGFVKGLDREYGSLFSELAVGDSSEQALGACKSKLPTSVHCYQLDVYRLLWKERWDAIFMLDVVEHLEDDQRALCEVYQALRPGGLLVLTAPAFQRLWSHNDVFVGHKRRYTKKRFDALATNAGFEACHLAYFCFFLSPLVYLSRLRSPRIDASDVAAVEAYVEKTHRVPSAWINTPLRLIFELESRLASYLNFPWGTSVLGIFEKPRS
ncbi:MAG: class I SAM-dependent methyltransferase [Bdellovibrionales bacterium]|nr:class I SAM-dependent methyltransferase [Bdellovibrionales bacterium]